MFLIISFRINRSLFWPLQKSSPHPPDALRNPGLVDVVHRVRNGPSVCPRNWGVPFTTALKPRGIDQAGNEANAGAHALEGR